MKVEYIINNYTLGSYFTCTPLQYLIHKERVDSHHTRVVYDVPNEKVKNTIDKMLARPGKIL